MLSGPDGGGRLKMRKVFIIGIGSGNPDYVTVQAINALNEVDVFFVMDKGPETEDLVRLRKEICERYIKDKSYRTIQVRDPERAVPRPVAPRDAFQRQEGPVNARATSAALIVANDPFRTLERS